MEDSLEFLAEANCTNNHFIIDDLFNFPQEDNKAISEGLFFEPVNKGGNSADSSTAVDSCNSSVSGGDTTQFNGNLSGRSFTDVQFPDGELCVPYDDLAELEWLSNFVEESFSSDDMNNLQFIPTTTTPPSATTPAASIGASSSSATLISDDNPNQPSLPMFSPEVSVPGKARSKRSRTAPCDWSSRLLHLYQSPASSPARNNPPKNINCNPTGVNTLVIGNYNNNHLNLARKQRRLITDTPARKCLHCASEKTPQWRTGPLGPKTLCNACGVRYKSGRLVPEYRPASSPTFVPAKHSNSHRKVLEMRRQKETQIEQPLLTQNDIFGLSNGGDDYLIHQPLLMNGHDFSQMIA